ncbi:hypothetical protein [Enterobacter kobei]|uniref:hypothetical protein n=1 Tax=Enterobacter kobei TaxID=208224 RepID=UPI003EDAD2C5
MMNAKELELKLSDALQREDILKEKLAESKREFRAADATIENLQMKVEKLAVELSAVEAIHNEAVFITDEHYEQCPPEVQKMIRSLAVLQIPAYQAFLAEVRAQGVDSAINTVIAMMNHQHPVTSKAIDILRVHAYQIRKGVQS